MFYRRLSQKLKNNITIFCIFIKNQILYMKCFSVFIFVVPGIDPGPLTGQTRALTLIPNLSPFST